jgi:hypothetical protein
VAAPSSPAATSRWERLVEEMLAGGSATYGNADGPRRAFGSTSLKTDGRVFAMLVQDRLVVKLPAGRVSALVAEGVGDPFDPGHGRIQREWLSVRGEDLADWRPLAVDSEAFVARRAR